MKKIQSSEDEYFFKYVPEKKIFFLGFFIDHNFWVNFGKLFYIFLWPRARTSILYPCGNNPLL